MTLDILSSVNSMITAIFLVLLSFFISGLIAFSAILSKNNITNLMIRGASNLTENIPILLWLFVLIIGFRDSSRFALILLTFLFAALPYVSTILYGEFERLWHAEFIESAKIAGINNFRIINKFILPNALPVILPISLNLYGAALTVNGVIGLLGMGNRMDFEIGTLLMRGKEYALVNPMLLILGILALFFIFLFIYIVISEIREKFRHEPELETTSIFF